MYAEYDPDTRSGLPGADRKIKGKTLHWVSVAHCRKCEVRLYDRLWNVENPRDEKARLTKEEGLTDLEAMKRMMNPDSLKVLKECYLEEWAADKKPGDYLQFQRIGYLMPDIDTTPEYPVYNRTVGLKDNWKK